MKICRLKLKNLNSFREEVDIDFEDPLLADASLVAITGPTGAGKTTLLDAICVALYGKTPRLGGRGSQNSSHLVSHGETEGFAEVHFEADGTRYIASWSLRRGRSTNSTKVRLSYAADNKLISDKLSAQGKSLGSSQKAVSEEVESILALDFGAFRRSVMLAQGEFAAFLKAKSEERRKILEATAGIHIYDVLRQALLDKVAEVEAVNADVLAKIEKIPEASREQLAEAETKLDRLQTEAGALDEHSEQVEKDKQQEAKRKEDFEKLQSSEERQAELLSEQQEIDALQVERKSAERAKDLRAEKREYDTAKSELDKAEETLDTATDEKTDAETQVEVDRADFDEKEEAYQTASTEHTEKTAIYTAAQLDVQRASDQFAEVDARLPKLAGLDNQIDTLSDGLTNSKAEQIGLQKQIEEAQTFLDDNPLPANRQHRLTQANVLLAQLDSQENQLETALATKVQHEKIVVSSKRKIKELSKAREKRLSEKMDAETALENATLAWNTLLKDGTHEHWTERKQQATKAQPIAHKYEIVRDDLTHTENQRADLENTLSSLEIELQQIESELAAQAEACRHAEEVVQRFEDELESARLADPINQLRQHLHAGEPCLVCGATDHPYADKVESEDDDRLRNALKDARAEAKTAQDQMQTLKVKQTLTEENKRNTANQIKDCESEIETLQDEQVKYLAAWQMIYPDEDVSSDAAAEQIEKADTTLAALGDAEQARTTASHAYDMALHQLETCEVDLAREGKSLEDIEEQLQDAINAVADLQAGIKSTEGRFWEFLPEAFHSIAPDVAVDQFNEKIEEVAAYTDKLDTAKTNLKLLDTKIETDENNLENLRQNCDDLQDEIDEYRYQGKALLDTVREKTDGLETKDKIAVAIKQLEVALKAKAEARDKANNRLQESQKLLTRKETTHENADGRYEECERKFETARKIYFDKLKKSNFDSPEAHDNAFRDETQMQDLSDQIDAHEDEKQQLALDITELRTRFEETPFDPEALEQIETQMKEIQAQLQEKLKGIGTQQKVIDDLKKHLEQREALSEEVAAAKAELRRWKNLKDTIPGSTLRDFALEIVFKQMGVLANVQLDYLTSERYQLKVESIGNLTVIDRWNANEERPVETLSGGESFLTSLALALALADLSRGRAELNSLFLDEGFGTLDAETLDVAIAALEGLRMQGRSIFLISHVQELTRRIPVKINVRKRGDGSSSVQIQG